MRSEPYELLIVGGGPAGAVCAAFCARDGLRTLVLEKSRFPREKVCGDCLNPAAWPVLDRLEIGERILASRHAKLRAVDFIGLDGTSVRVPLNHRERGEIAIRRSVLDALLLDRAKECGAEVVENSPVTRVERDADGNWRVEADGRTFAARFLVAADGRNSTVARLCGLLPRASRDRVGLQTHVPAAPDTSPTVSLRLLPHGYCGSSPLSLSEMNICLVSSPETISSLRRWAEREFDIASDAEWRTIAPLARPSIQPAHDRLLLVGDAARVVEPFTGEGIYYAIASGELAATFLRNGSLEGFAEAHSALYSGRLWVNRLARWAVTNPRQGTLALDILRRFPPALRYLTSQIVRP